MSKRTYYSKKFKYNAIKEVINGKNFEEVLRSSGFDVDSALKKDKKYCSKLLHKWKKEVYQRNELLYFANNEITEHALKNEIEALQDEDSHDEIMDNIKDKILQGATKYKNLKNRITSDYLIK